MKKPLLILVFVFCYECIPVLVSGAVPVLLRLPRSEQPDTMGCNFVQEVTSLVYGLVINGRVKLWDSPAKEIQITGSTLLNLEKSSQTKFIDQEIIFIYENWEKTKTNILSVPLGFTFLNYNSRNEEVSYGYVDFNDMKEIFMRTKINTNANGYYEISYGTYLYKKLFNYNIVQFNGKAITTGGESKDIKQKFIGKLEFNSSITLPAISERFITFVVDDFKSSSDPKNLNSIELLRKVGVWLSFNEEVFFNLGGDKILNYIQKNSIKVTRIGVNEIWKKSRNEIISETKTITIYVNDSALNPLSFDEFINWGIQINDKSSYEIFKDKDFSFVITDINSQKIARKDSYLYYKGLMTYDWGKLTEFVKYY